MIMKWLLLVRIAGATGLVTTQKRINTTNYAVFANSFDEAREILKNHIGEKPYIFEYILPHINLKSKVTDP